MPQVKQTRGVVPFRWTFVPRTLAVIACSAALAMTALIAPSSASATASPTQHAMPYNRSGGGVAMLCYDTGYGCASGGYDGTAGQFNTGGWTPTQYWSWGSGGGPQRHNCTTYAAFKLERNGVGFPGWTDNANGWDTKAQAHGTPVDQTPAVGAIGQWNGGSAGHVAYVEAVTADYVEFTSDNYGGGTNRFRVSNGSAYLPDNYLHFRDLAGASSYPDGTFVQRSGHPEIYRLAGGAPIYVSSWDAFGGGKPTVQLGDARFASLPAQPTDGTFLVGARRGEVYRVAGGAPLYVGTWDAFGGPQPVVAVDDWSIDNAGRGGVTDHLRYRPADGTFLTGAQRGEVYRVAGGAPIYVSTWDAFGGGQPTVTVDQQAIDNAGATGPWDHLTYRPVNGTFIVAAQRGEVYSIAGGAPIYVSTWDAFGGPQAATPVDAAAIDGAGGGVYSHLLLRPVDGTFLRGAQTGNAYAVTAGIAVPVTDWTVYGGPQPTVTVDQAAVDQAGQPSPWNHLSAPKPNPSQPTAPPTVPAAPPAQAVGLSPTPTPTPTQAAGTPLAAPTSASTPSPTVAFDPPNVTVVAATTPAKTAAPPDPHPIIRRAYVGQRPSCSADPRGLARVTYAWYRDGALLRGQAGTTGPMLRPTDQGHAYLCRLRGTFESGTRTWRSPSTRVGAAQYAIVRAPQITGGTRPGSLLTATSGTWSPNPPRLTHQWTRDGKPVAKATGSTYRIRPGDRHHRIGCVVTAQGPGHSATPTAVAARNVP